MISSCASAPPGTGSQLRYVPSEELAAQVAIDIRPFEACPCMSRGSRQVAKELKATKLIFFTRGSSAV